MSEALQVVLSKGCVTLRGSLINAMARKWRGRCSGESIEHAANRRLQRDGEEYHITLIAASELKTIAATSSSIIQALNETIQNTERSSDIYDLGVGCHQEQCYFVVVFAPFIQKTRLQLKLSPIDLHITLGFHDQDIHTIRKGFSTLWVPGSVTDTQELISNIELILRAKSSTRVREFLEYTLIAEYAMRLGYLFGAYYVAKYQDNTTVSTDILEQTITDSEKCLILKRPSWIQSSSTSEIRELLNYGDLVCKALNHSLYSPLLYHHRLRRFYSSQEGINRYEINFIEMPRNFSFVSTRLAGSSLPATRKDFENLSTIGITDVITVMEGPLDSAHTSGLPIKFHWFEVQDRTPPTIEQMKEMMVICDGDHDGSEEKKVLVHCLGGVGRTATVLASHLMWSLGLTRSEAKQPLIDNRRTIISQSQDDFMTSWYSVCLDRIASEATSQNKTSTNTSSITQTTILQKDTPTRSHQQASVAKKVKFPPLIMCVGYPASGKSTFADALCSAHPDKLVRINQDEMGRKECEMNIGKHIKAKKTVILDRCNLTQKERKEWMGLANNSKAWVIFFSTPVEECKWRIVRRVGHPTLKDGRGGRVIDSLAGTIECPNPKLEGFEQYYEVQSFDASNELLKSWGCESEPVSTIPEELGLLKFPRTHHLANLGSATRDDLLIPKDDVEKFFLNKEVLIEEKIDGANMGLSICDHQIRAQNRSHYVSSEYHPQFKYLEKWIHQHAAALWEVLQSDRYILYGEWCYAKHSIPYDALSDWFTAFDMFDRLENKFWSRSRLEAHLEGTGIALIPLIAKGSFPNIEALKNLVQTKSRYYDGPVEGIVVRVVDAEGEYVERRGKIVRSDFLSGDTHWMKHACNPNTVVRRENAYS
mmetsp:Transcript_22755/g.38507  ORF Transcript_22755/g.38507 Transcript_22755/m.38507 type:complete len:877 (-) Transcript_22755:717-3347(-)